MLTKALTAQEYAAAYGDHGLVRLAERGERGRVPKEAISFLSVAGLPVRIIYHEFVSGSELTFEQLRTGLWPVRAEKTRNPLPESYSKYWIIGDEYFVQGGAWWCITEGSGRIVRVDDYGPDLVNTSVERLASAPLAGIRWTEACTYTAANWSAQVDVLEREIRGLDPVAMNDPRGFWPRWFGVVRAEVPRPEEPGESGFRKPRRGERRYRDTRREVAHRFGPEERKRRTNRSS